MICHSFDDGAGNINWWQHKLSFIWWYNLKSNENHIMAICNSAGASWQQPGRSRGGERLMVVMNEIIFHIRWSHISKWGWKCVFVLGCHNLWNYVRFRINIIPHPSCHGQRGWGEGRGCHSVAGELIAIQYEKFNTLMLHRWWRLRIAMTINNIARSVATVQLQLTRTGRTNVCTNMDCKGVAGRLMDIGRPPPS